jgi:hypothetical protein
MNLLPKSFAHGEALKKLPTKATSSPTILNRQRDVRVSVQALE